MSAAQAQERYKQGLRALEAVTEDELRVAMGKIPSAIREKLAQGPLAQRWDCGVCSAFVRDWWMTCELDPTDPAWIVWAYHEVPKAHMRFEDQRYYGSLANETYIRCIATYRAAGWEGEAQEPNA